MNTISRLNYERGPSRLWTAAAAILLAWHLQATPDRGANCVSCHGTPLNGMQLQGYQGTTNFGSGTLKYYKVQPGQTVVITYQVTNDWGGTFGLTLNKLNNAGLSNATDRLVYTPDSTWANRSSFFTVGPTAGPSTWPFNLKVATNTPADVYLLQSIMAGLDSGGTRWSDAESFYLQVAAPASAPSPMIASPQRGNGTFSAKVTTVSGFTYYLEYKTSLSATTWSIAAQVAGDGTQKTLTDPNATDAERVYHVRVQ